MTLFKKALSAFAVLVVLTVGGDALVIRQATAAANQVDDFKSRAAAFQRAVLGMKNDFYLYDDQNNMYVLVAATSPDDVQLIEDTYQQGAVGIGALLARKVRPTGPVVVLLSGGNIDMALHRQLVCGEAA